MSQGQEQQQQQQQEELFDYSAYVPPPSPESLYAEAMDLALRGVQRVEQRVNRSRIDRRTGTPTHTFDQALQYDSRLRIDYERALGETERLARYHEAQQVPASDSIEAFYGKIRVTAGTNELEVIDAKTVYPNGESKIGTSDPTPTSSYSSPPSIFSIQHRFLG